MKAETQKKWAAAVLGVVALALLVNLVRTTFVGSGAPSPPVPRPPAGAQGRASAKAEFSDLTRYNPEVQLDLLDKLDSRPAPALDRNPFEYGPSREEIQAQERARTTPPPPPAPPPPPPVTVKALGYKDGPNGRLAFFEDQETGGSPEAGKTTYRAREGESFGNRYKVLKITATGVTIEDESSHLPAQLPYAETPQ